MSSPSTNPVETGSSLGVAPSTASLIADFESCVKTLDGFYAPPPASREQIDRARASLAKARSALEERFALLESRLADAEQDSKRLDWMASNDEAWHVMYIWMRDRCEGTLREAIDKALASPDTEKLK